MGGGATEVNVGCSCDEAGADHRAPPCASRPIEEKIAITTRFATEMLPFFESGACGRSSTAGSPSTTSPPRTPTWQTNANVGKIVIDVDPADGDASNPPIRDAIVASRGELTPQSGRGSDRQRSAMGR